MKAYLINMHLLVPRSRSSAKVKVRYIGHISKKKKKNGRFGGIRVSQTHLVRNVMGTDCRNLSGGKYFPITVNIFPHAENLELLFSTTSFVDKVINEKLHIIYFISLWLIKGKYLPKRGNVRKDMSAVMA